jgi:hypothetical protein
MGMKKKGWPRKARKAEKGKMSDLFRVLRCREASESLAGHVDYICIYADGKDVSAETRWANGLL